MELGRHLLRRGLRRIALASLDGELLERSAGEIIAADGREDAVVRVVPPQKLHDASIVLLGRHASGSAPGVSTELRAGGRVRELLEVHAPEAPLIVACEPRELLPRIFSGDRHRRLVLSAGSAIEAGRAACAIAARLSTWTGDVRCVALGGPGRALVLPRGLASVSGIPLEAMGHTRGWGALLAVLREGRPASDRESAAWAATACAALLGGHDTVLPALGEIEGIPSTALCRFGRGSCQGSLRVPLDDGIRAELAEAAALMQRRAREHGL